MDGEDAADSSLNSATAPRRAPVCLVRCREHYVNGAEAAALPFDAALAGSHSLALLDGVATLEECAWLREQAGAAADEERLLRLSQTDSDAGAGCRAYGEDGMRCDGQTGRIRAPVTRLLGAEGQALCDAILLRAVARLNELLPGLLDRLFGPGVLTRTLLHNQGLVFSPGEPALNVYGPGGHFDAHTDKQSLTILVPLSYASTDADAGAAAAGAMAGAYSGGGTAFWSVHARAPHATDDETAEAAATTIKRDEPTLVLRPPPGRAIVFGGQLTHAGLPVLEGRRCILVASFSARTLVTGDAELRARWSSPVLPRRAQRGF